MKATVYRMFEAWKRREALQDEAERLATQRIGRYPVIELADPSRNLDGTQSEWVALLDAKPRRPR